MFGLKEFCIANQAPFTLIVESLLKTGYCLVLYVPAYIAGGGSHESKWFFQLSLSFAGAPSHNEFTTRTTISARCRG